MIYIMAAILLVIFLYINNNYIQTTYINIDKKISSSIHIAVFSDLHSKQYGRNNQYLLERIQSLNVDFICIVGDLINDDLKHFYNIVTFVKQLQVHCQVVYIYGNHECRTKAIDKIEASFSKSGVCVLSNQIASFKVRGQDVVFLGMDERMGLSKKDYIKQLMGKSRLEDRNKSLVQQFEKMQGTKILLSHFPETFEKKGYEYRQYNVDVQISGHAHGGQIRIPFLGGVIAPGQGLFPKYTSGLYGSGPYLVVSRGLGSSFFPFRIFNLPHIIKLTIK